MTKRQKLIKKNKRKYLIISILLAAALFVILIANTHMGAMRITAGDIMKIVFGKLFHNEKILSSVKDNITAVIWEIRIPRIICGIAVGAGLASAGVIFQSILQNPLADPYTLGISTGASFGASLAIYLNIALNINLPIPVFALAMAFITLITVIAVARRGESFLSSNLIIAGIIVSSVLSSGVSLIKMLAGEDVSAIVFWLMGSLSAKSWSDVYLVVPCVAIMILTACFFAKELDIMSLGDENARSLGVNTARIRMMYLIIGAAITAVCVSVCGVIGFVGLIIPHLLRMRFTAKNSILIPLSALSGGVLLSLADNLTRVLANGEIPVGILTTLIGGPFFIYIFIKRSRK